MLMRWIRLDDKAQRFQGKVTLLFGWFSLVVKRDYLVEFLSWWKPDWYTYNFEIWVGKNSDENFLQHRNHEFIFDILIFLNVGKHTKSS